MAEQSKPQNQKEIEVGLINFAKNQSLHSEVRIKHGDNEIRCTPKEAYEIQTMIESVLKPVL